MYVELTHRLGQNPAGTQVDLTDIQAHWLVAKGHAIYPAETAVDETDEQHAPDAPEEGAEDSTEGMTQRELQEQCKALGLPVYGSKATLAQRLSDHAATGQTTTAEEDH